MNKINFNCREIISKRWLTFFNKKLWSLSSSAVRQKYEILNQITLGRAQFVWKYSIQTVCSVEILLHMGDEMIVCVFTVRPLDHIIRINFHLYPENVFILTKRCSRFLQIIIIFWEERLRANWFICCAFLCLRHFSFSHISFFKFKLSFQPLHSRHKKKLSNAI